MVEIFDDDIALSNDISIEKYKKILQENIKLKEENSDLKNRLKNIKKTLKTFNLNGCSNCYNDQEAHVVKDLSHRFNNAEASSGRVTYRELSTWLSKGNGEIKIGDSISNSFVYRKDLESKPVSRNIHVRRIGEMNWYIPTEDFINGTKS